MTTQRIIGIVLIIIALIAKFGGGELPAVIIFVIIGLFLIVKKSKTKEQKQQLKKEKEKLQKHNETHVKMKHILGLPLAENTECIVGFENDRFEFKGGGNSFTLNFNKITAINVLTDTEIQKQYISSVGGAVGGAVLLGPLGAMIGGRAKEKRTTTNTYYLNITYIKDDKITYMSFEIPVCYTSSVKKWEQNFIPIEQKNIEL